MPNRIIKESIRESESVDGLSPQAEVTFYRLITYADDYGLFKADPRLLLSALYPLKNFKPEQITKWMDEIGSAGMITFYEADGKCFGKFITWEEHQQVRNKKPRFPMPNGCNQFSSLSEARNHLKSNEIICFDESNPILSNPIQSESNPNSAQSLKTSEPFVSYVIEIPLVRAGECYGVTDEQVRDWEEAYPAVDVMQALRSMRQWSLANQMKRKTRRGVLKFVTGWLSREQDRGGNHGPKTKNATLINEGRRANAKVMKELDEIEKLESKYAVRPE